MERSTGFVTSGAGLLLHARNSSTCGRRSARVTMMADEKPKNPLGGLGGIVHILQCDSFKSEDS